MSDEGLVTIEGRPITYLNFEGKEGQYNVKGSRNFCTVLDPALAEELRANRWNVRESTPKEEGDEPFFYLQVKVQYGGFKPPIVVMITAKGQTILSEEMVSVLDAVDIKKVDIVIRPYDHNNGGTGRGAYLKTMFVTIDEDPLMKKYGFTIGSSLADEPGE